MYEKFFGLSCRPFDLAPDPKFFCMTEQHARAASNVRYALKYHDSFVVISGEIGTGKTTVLNAALKELGPQYVKARIVHTTLTGIELLQSLLSEFGIPDYDIKKVKLLDELRNFFLEQHLAGRHVVIIVDEAQHLNPAALEELRLLTCIDSQDRRIVSIVLTGQPSLDDVLDDASLTQLRQRTRLRQRLSPMNQAETVEYIRHRLRVAGGNADEIFAPETFPEIHRLTLGIPRLINTLCDTALTACMVESVRQVNLATIGVVVKELDWRWADAAGRRKREPGEVPVSSTPAFDPAMLLVHLPGKIVARIDIGALPFSIGRGQGNGLAIEAKEVSRRHALINWVDGRYTIEDLHSSNGLHVNGKQRDKATLNPGDVIIIGQVKLVFHLRDPAAEVTGERVTPSVDNLVAFAETQLVPQELAPAKQLGKRQARE
jgi:general secretion pathway protein A